jgi:hypothetical protein
VFWCDNPRKNTRTHVPLQTGGLAARAAAAAYARAHAPAPCAGNGCIGRRVDGEGAGCPATACAGYPPSNSHCVNGDWLCTDGSRRGAPGDHAKGRRVGVGVGVVWAGGLCGGEGC